MSKIIFGFIVGSLFGMLAAIPRPVVIHDDPGGQIDTYMTWYQRLIDSGTPVRINGECASACNLVLMLPREQVCVTRAATLGFHQVSIGHTPQPEMTNKIIEFYYPQIVKEWIEEYPSLVLHELLIMPYERIVALGVFPSCTFRSYFPSW